MPTYKITDSQILKAHEGYFTEAEMGAKGGAACAKKLAKEQ